jgi:hypothetical protein
MQPFIRTAFNSLRIVESMCLLCGRMVGASRDPEVLTIAEKAHLLIHMNATPTKHAEPVKARAIAAAAAK